MTSSLTRMAAIVTMGVCLAGSFARTQTLTWLDASFYNPVCGTAGVDGSSRKTISLESASLPEALTVAPNGTIFWSELRSTNARIYSRGSSTQSDSVRNAGLSNLRGIAVDADSNWIIAATSNMISKPTIIRFHPDSSGVQTLLTLDSYSSNPRSVVFHAGTRTVYWTEYSQGKIRSLATATGTVKDIVTGLSGPVGLALDTSVKRLYWTEAIGNTLKRSSLSGDSVTTILTGLSTPYGLALDTLNQSVYWTELSTPRIRKATVAGTSVQTLSISVTHPTGVGIVPAVATAITQQADKLPNNFALEQNYPNPFNPATTIGFTLPTSSVVSLKLYDIIGREIAEPLHATMSAGHHTAQWNAAAFPSGVYFYRLTVGTMQSMKKMLLVK